ncbi:MAG: methyltransferase domain-containing protein [Deltaproteobacteria bacterium]|nr:methyltransferase domain-containing protein [Deltaproteobacteria bacterium]
MQEHRRSYVPALGFHWLTRMYDPVVAVLLKEEKFKRALVNQAGLKPGHRVLDLGCGTGSLTIMLKRACPTATVVGLDGDPAVLAIARAKIAAADVHVELQEGLAFAPPFAPASFDRVVSSLVFHHLTTEDKRRSLARVRELLRPGGELHITDWGQAQNPLMRLAFLSVQALDGFRTTTDNVRGRLISFMQEAGFTEVAETHRAMTPLGTLSRYRAIAPT